MGAFSRLRNAEKFLHIVAYQSPIFARLNFHVGIWAGKLTREVTPGGVRAGEAAEEESKDQGTNPLRQS